MSDLSDVERDALLAMAALTGLNRHLAGLAGEADERRMLQVLLTEGGAAGERVLAYLRQLRGAGDGSAAEYPTWLGPWREWCPPRGDMLTGRGDRVEAPARRVVHPRPRGDPGE